MPGKEKILPKEIIVFKNGDKMSFKENWNKSKNLANIPAPFRWCIVGKPNAGKTNMILNILVQQKPEFEKVFIWSESPLSKEYDLIEDEYKTVFDKCPTLDELTDEIDPITHKPPKSVLICDDIQLEALNKEDYTNFCKIMKHISSHYNVSVIVTAHDLIQLPKVCRRLCDVVTIFKIQPETIKILGQKLGVPNELIYRIYSKNITDFHDSLTIDMTEGTPARFRKNIFEPIDENEYKDSAQEVKNFKIPIVNLLKPIP